MVITTLIATVLKRICIERGVLVPLFFIFIIAYLTLMPK